MFVWVISEKRRVGGQGRIAHLSSSRLRRSAVEVGQDRAFKARNLIASNGGYNLFRPLLALLELPKMPVFPATRHCCGPERRPVSLRSARRLRRDRPA